MAQKGRSGTQRTTGPRSELENQTRVVSTVDELLEAGISNGIDAVIDDLSVMSRLRIWRWGEAELGERRSAGKGEEKPRKRTGCESVAFATAYLQSCSSGQVKPKCRRSARVSSALEGEEKEFSLDKRVRKSRSRRTAPDRRRLPSHSSPRRPLPPVRQPHLKLLRFFRSLNVAKRFESFLLDVEQPYRLPVDGQPAVEAWDSGRIAGEGREMRMWGVSLRRAGRESDGGRAHMR
jgi:hypothetical protein